MNSFFAENLLLGSRFDFEDLEIDIEPNELAELFALESEYEKVSKKLKTNGRNPSKSCCVIYCVI